MKNLIDRSMNRYVPMIVTPVTIDIRGDLHVMGKEGCYEIFRCS